MPLLRVIVVDTIADSDDLVVEVIATIARSQPPPVIPPSLRKGIHMTYDIPHYSYVHSTPNITTTLITTCQYVTD